MVQGNFIGTNASGDNLGNVRVGVLIDNAPSNTIGGGNTIGFNTVAGIEITGASSTDDLVLGNLIGTNGTASQANGVGVLIDTGAHNNTLDSNTIGGNTDAGVSITGASTTGNVVVGNLVGLQGSAGPWATASVCSSATRPTTRSAGRNTIGFNAVAGIEITGASSTGDVVLGNLIGTNGTASQANGVGVLIDTGAHNNTLDSNTIGGNTSAGVSITGASTTGNVVVGNLVGLQGSAGPLGNSIGVLLSDAPSNTIGGGNTIGFNAIAGIEITGASSTSDLVLGNLIGTNGTASQANGVGVLIDTGAHNNTLDSNTIGGNTSAGVSITGASTTGNVVVGNLVGLQGSTGPLGNSIGVLLSDAPSNTIGGGNTIGFNAIAGIEITGASSTGDLVLGNLIGTNGTVAQPNGVGVLIDSAAQNNTLDSNTIGGNTNAGVSITGASTTGNVVVGNLVGLQGSAGPLGNSVGVLIDTAHNNTLDSNTIGGNTSAGIFINDAQNNLIGGATDGAINVISGNGTGIRITGGGGNLIREQPDRHRCERQPCSGQRVRWHRRQ